MKRRKKPSAERDAVNKRVRKSRANKKKIAQTNREEMERLLAGNPKFGQFHRERKADFAGRRGKSFAEQDD